MCVCVLYIRSIATPICLDLSRRSGAVALCMLVRAYNCSATRLTTSCAQTKNSLPHKTVTNLLRGWVSGRRRAIYSQWSHARVFVQIARAKRGPFIGPGNVHKHYIVFV